MGDVWDRLSAGYDRQLPLERPALLAMIDVADPGPEDMLLDLGTGTGAVLRCLASRPRRPARAVGVDSSQGMLARVPPLPDGWTTERGSATGLRFVDGSFDLLTASYLLQVMRPCERAPALAEILRVLRPGGRLVTATPVIREQGVARLVGRLAHALAAVAPGRLGGLRSLDPRQQTAAAGLTITRVRFTGRGYPSICVAAISP